MFLVGQKERLEMVIYEVNLKIQHDIFDQYMNWLTPHVTEMLTFRGFISAKYLREVRSPEDKLQHMTVQYTVEAMSDLDDYLDNHSRRMREDGLSKFPGKFSATRRFFEIEKEF
jgi:hypothetical protein